LTIWALIHFCHLLEGCFVENISMACLPALLAIQELQSKQDTFAARLEQLSHQFMKVCSLA
jgi:hypothetical protein